MPNGASIVLPRYINTTIRRLSARIRRIYSVKYGQLPRLDILARLLYIYIITFMHEEVVNK